jgi:hypothetical protein
MSRRHKKSRHAAPTRRKPLVLIAMFLILIGTGVVDGLITNRWSPSDELERASEAIQNIPATIGAWEGEENELDERSMRIAAATGAVKRTYRHRETGQWVSVTLLCGPHGPISLHPPTVCFTSAGWVVENNPESTDFAFGQDATCHFWQADFGRIQDHARQRIVTNWGWNDGTGWKASANPRFEYAGSPYLFKLYFTSNDDLASEQHKHVRDEFIRLFLDEFDRTVLDQIQDSTSRNEK